MSDENPTTSFMQAMGRIEDGGRSDIRNLGAWERPQLKIVMLNSVNKLPAYAHDGDSGLDLAAVVNHYIPVGAWLKIPLGVAIGLEPGYEAQIRPRSSLSANGIWCALGTIDQGYTGELAAVLYNFTPFEYEVKAGQRICQLVVVPIARAQVVEVQKFEETSRGDGGFGSTDKVKP